MWDVILTGKIFVDPELASDGELCFFPGVSEHTTSLWEEFVFMLCVCVCFYIVCVCVFGNLKAC